MLRTLCVLLLVSWNHHIDCAETDVVNATAFRDGGFARNWRLKGNKVIKWQDKFNPHKQFFYLTYDPRNDYCEITQVPTESPDDQTLTCRYKLRKDEEDLQIYGLIVPNNVEKNDVIELSYSSAKSRAKNGWHIGTMNFTKCRDEKLHKSDGSIEGEPTAQMAEVKTMTGPAPLPAITGSNLTSEANGRKTICELDDPRTTITCTQWDADGKKLLDAVKYNLPRHWKADWFRIHNLKASGAVLLVFSDCPDGKCNDLSVVKLTSKGDEGGRFVHPGLDLECSEIESSLTFDIADIPKGFCFHMVCSEDHYKRKSKVKNESYLLSHKTNHCPLSVQNK